MLCTNCCTVIYTYWFSLRNTPYTWSRCRTHGICGRWTGNALSSYTPDPISDIKLKGHLCITVLISRNTMLYCWQDVTVLMSRNTMLYYWRHSACIEKYNAILLTRGYWLWIFMNERRMHRVYTVTMRNYNTVFIRNWTVKIIVLRLIVLKSFTYDLILLRMMRKRCLHWHIS